MNSLDIRVPACRAPRRVPGAAVLAGLAVVFLSVTGARGEAPEDLVEVMRRADAASRRLRAVAYDVETFGIGDLATRVPHVHAKVLARKGRVGFFAAMTGSDRKASPPSLRFTGSYEGVLGTAKSFDIGTNGRRVFSIDQEAKRFVEGDAEKASQLIDPYKSLFMIEYFHPTPFHDEIAAPMRRYEGQVDIGDVTCDVIYVAYQREGYDARWYIAREDSLPRRVDRIVFRDGKPVGERALVVTNLNTQPLLTPNDFSPSPPPGFDRRAFEAPPARVLLTAGSTAPDFELLSPDGASIALSSLRGNVVVLDFWATWCVPCKLSMPQMQSLHEKFADQPVKVLALNCWDASGDPVKMMKTAGLTYDLLLEADKVAVQYGVNSIPAVFVIDPQGVIQYAHSGFVPTLERKVEQAVRQCLSGEAPEASE